MSNIITRNNPLGLVDPFFDEFFTGERNSNNHIMKTDIKDMGESYLLKIDLPEIKKEDIHLSLDNGYLTVSASLHEEQDEKKHGHYIRKERYYGTFERQFYVGDGVTEDDVKAKLENGVLSLTVSKKDKVENKKYITIE